MRYFNTVLQVTAENKQGLGRSKYTTTSKSDFLIYRIYRSETSIFFFNKGHYLKINHVLGLKSTSLSSFGGFSETHVQILTDIKSKLKRNSDTNI